MKSSFLCTCVPSCVWILLACLSVVLFPGAVRGQGQITNDLSGIPSSVGANSETASEGKEETAPASGEQTVYRTIKYVGKYHLMVLHFPITFLLTAMLAQWYAVATGRCGNLVAMLLVLGAVSAVAAAALGWMYAHDSVYFGEDEKILFWHRWLGTGTAIVASIVAVSRKRLGPKSLGFALTICAVCVAAAAHFGGSLVYGADFFTKF